MPALPVPNPAARTPLRESGRGAADGDAGKVVHLVPDDGAGTVGSHADLDEPPRPPSGGGARPSLKRIK